MIKQNIEVKIPKHKIRIKKQNNNSYVYYVLGRKGDSLGNTKDIVVNIGKVSKKGFMNPNDKYFEYFKSEDLSIQTIESSEFDNQSKIGAVTAIKHIAKETGIDDCLSLVFGKDADLILSLASYYVINRDSAAMLYSDFMFDHYGITKDIASEATISRLFNSHMTIEKVDAFRQAYLKHCYNKYVQDKKDMRYYVDIDSTNCNVSSSNCDNAEFGKPKIDEDLPQINMAYFYDRTTGKPIFYEFYYGSIVDLSYCLTGIKNFYDNLNVDSKNVKYDFILDRGYFSQPNLSSLKSSKISFAVLGKKNNTFKSYIAKFRNEINSSENLLSLGSYGMRTKGIAFDKSKEEYYIYLYFDSTKEMEEKTGIETKLLTALEAVKGKESDPSGGLVRTYGNYLNIDVFKSSKRIKSVSINKENVDSLLSEAGFFWIVSTIEMEPKEMLEAYRNRDDIEKCFRLLKSENDLNKTYAQNNVALNAKLLMGFITAILRSEFNYLTREVVQKKTNLSVQKMILALDKIIMYKVNGHYGLKYNLTAQQCEIMNALNMKKEEITEVITDFNLSLQNNK